MMATRRIMKEFSIAEISGVDEPAQAPALMTLMKAKSSGQPADEFGKHKEAIMAKTVEELQVELTKSAEDNAKLATDLAKTQADLKDAEMKAKLTPEEMAALADEADTAKKARLLAEPELMKAAVTNRAAANPIIYKSATGDEYRKSDDPRLVTMAKRADADAADLAKMREAAVDESFEKRATTEFAKFKGTAPIKGALLKAVAGIKDEDTRTAVGEMLKAVHGAMGVMFKEVGTGADDTTGDDTGGDLKKAAETKLDQLAKAHMAKNAGMTFAKAYDAVLSTEEGSKLYAESAA